MYIRILDSPDHAWEKHFIEICGLKFDKYWENCEILTKEILESHLESILSHLKTLEESISDKVKIGWKIDSWEDLVIGYQILGILILQTGSYLPEYIQKVILDSTDWEFDKKRGWSKEFEEERKFYLNDFRDKIINHKVGKKDLLFIKYY